MTGMIQIVNGNANRLPLTAESVHTIITSSPYWALRDYGLPPTVWGGDAGCAHEWAETVEPGGTGSGKSGRRDRKAGRSRGGAQPGFCVKCGAWKGCLGLEPTPELFVQNMVEVAREWWRVLRKDGTLWLNLGDSFSGGGNGRNDTGRVIDGKPIGRKTGVYERTTNRVPPNLKAKDQVGIPFMVAMALRADGWYWRSTVPWIKRNAMPDNATDRPGVSHEYMFLFSKSRFYYYDTDAVRQPPADYYRVGGSAPYDANSGLTHGKSSSNFHQMATNGRLRRTGDSYYDSIDLLIDQTERYAAHLRHVRDNGGMMVNPDGSPAALLVNTRPYAGAHFASFPEEIVEPCIRASTSEHGVCAECGAQWQRVVEKPDFNEQPKRKEKKLEGEMIRKGDGFLTSSGQAWQDWRDENPDIQVGWSPTCECGTDEVEPAVVLDSFAGSGTAGQTAVRLRRRAVLVDLNHKYLSELATERTANVQMELPV